AQLGKRRDQRMRIHEPGFTRVQRREIPVNVEHRKLAQLLPDGLIQCLWKPERSEVEAASVLGIGLASEARVSIAQIHHQRGREDVYVVYRSGDWMVCLGQP